MRVCLRIVPRAWRLWSGWRGSAHGLMVAALAVSIPATAAAAAPSALSAPARQPAGLAGPAAAPAAPVAGQAFAGPARLAGARSACDVLPPTGSVTCLALVDTGVHWTGATWAAGPAPATRPRTSPPATEAAGSEPAPYMAADLQAAYRLPSALLGGRQTIAIVDAFDDPNAAADLAVYRAANNLPPCDAAFPCFTKVNQDGQQGPYPPPDPGWAVEDSLDVDMASATCPNCRIVLVEANDNTDQNMAAAVDEAVKLGANVVSNSYGEPEYNGQMSVLGPHYDHPGTAIVAASGDFGFGVSVPAALPEVVAVGGTALYRDGSARGWAETAWPGSGSGCSAYVAKPAWQHDRLCGMRTVADVAGVADPATPVATYDTFDLPGWIAVGGTSVGSPIVAGIYALAGNTASITAGAWLYAHRGDLNDVTTGALFDGTDGSNGYCVGGYLCAAGPGYDGPTGNGTPDGIGAF